MKLNNMLGILGGLQGKSVYGMNSLSENAKNTFGVGFQSAVQEQNEHIQQAQAAMQQANIDYAQAQMLSQQASYGAYSVPSNVLESEAFKKQIQEILDKMNESSKEAKIKQLEEELSKLKGQPVNTKPQQVEVTIVEVEFIPEPGKRKFKHVS